MLVKLSLGGMPRSQSQRFSEWSSYCSLTYSALACFRMGMSGSASFQRAKKSWYRSFRLGGVTGKRVGPAQLQVGQCADELVGDDAGVVENLLKLDSSGGALLRC